MIESHHLNDIVIERMIFHVVGPDDTNLVLLEEIEPGEHAEFFVDRIRAASNGVMFDFVAASPVLASLLRVEEDAARFVSETKDLATLFNTLHSGAASVGVFLVFVLNVAGERLYAIIKYDHEEVLSYTIEEKDDVRRALIAALTSTFVRSPDALQKSAIIRLTGAGGELSVRDRVAPSKITRYFSGFLGARRRFQPDQLTTTLAEITKKAALKHAGTLGPAIMSQLNRRVYDALQAQPGFDPGNREPFLAAVFGPLPKDSPVRSSFDKELRNSRIENEVFDFDRNAVPRPRRKHMVTDEGIEVIYDRQFENRVRRETLAGGGERIVIETGGIRVEDDYTESRSRLR
ncbi:hypothetical protein [Acidisoma sp. 7E03]